jgi:uncharacterized cofD-like protein
MFRSLKWLYPGISIKRWIALICLGIMMAMLGAVALVFYLLANPGPTVASARELAIMGFVLGGFTLFTGFYRLMRSVGSLVNQHGEYKDLAEIAYERRYLSRGPRIVCLGGGTGMSKLLSGLKHYTREINAVVSVADDGGSSGRLRRDFDILPPGDIRKCLVALSDDSPRMGQLLEHRFQNTKGELAGHSLGNLIITALTAITGDFGEACREAGRILSVRGRVLPATLINVTLNARHADGSETIGQRKISESEKRIAEIWLEPLVREAAPDIVEAIEQAELIVVGPGSLFTSVLPNLLIRDVTRAIRRSRAVKVYVCNVASSEGETRGYTLRDHIEALENHVGHGLVDHVMVNSGTFPTAVVRRLEEEGVRPVRWNPAEFSDRALPYRIVEADVISRDHQAWHDPEKLSRALLDLFNGVRSQ